MGLHRVSKSHLKVDEHGFRPMKKAYRPKSHTIQQPLDKELSVSQQVEPIQKPPVQQPTPLQQVVELEHQCTDNQQVTASPHLQVDATFLPIHNGFDVLRVEQDIVQNVDTSNNIALGADPIREDD